MGRKMRIGVLGAGAMGAEHVAALAAMADVEVVGVFSRQAKRAEAAAAACRAAATADVFALIDDPTIDAIDICTPSQSHEAYALAALARGKHVFCETPMALDLAAARRMRDAARAAGRLLQVGLLMRSVAPYQHIKAVAERGEHGRLVSLFAYRLGSYLRAGAGDHKAHYGDPSTELMTFDFDFANWLLGAPSRLAASGTDFESGPGEISAVLSYEGGAQATVVASGAMPAGRPFTAGFKARFEAALFELDNVFVEDGPPQSRFTVCDDASAPRDVDIEGHDPYALELRQFVDCIAGRADPALLDADRAIEALALSEAAQRSLKEGRTVERPAP